MSTSPTKTNGRRALRTLTLGAAAVTLATAGLATPASAATGTVAYDCLIFSTHFTYNAKVSVKSSGTAKVGKTVTITADLSALPGVAPVKVDSWKTTGKFTLSGAQKATITATGPNKKGPIPAKGHIPLGKITGKVRLTKAGKDTVTLGKLKITAVAFGSSVAMNCTPKKGKTLPKLLKLTVKR